MSASYFLYWRVSWFPPGCLISKRNKTYICVKCPCRNVTRIHVQSVSRLCCVCLVSNNISCNLFIISETRSVCVCVCVCVRVRVRACDSFPVEVPTVAAVRTSNPIYEPNVVPHSREITTMVTSGATSRTNRKSWTESDCCLPMQYRDSRLHQKWNPLAEKKNSTWCLVHQQHYRRYQQWFWWNPTF
jgi:hypothetical protein